MLRLWSDADTQPVWRVRLEDVGSGERWAFASLADLCRFLTPQETTNDLGDDASAAAPGAAPHEGDERDA